MVTTVELQLHLTVDIDKSSVPAYGTIRDTDAETVAMQNVQDYLYQALHGWGGDAAATKFANMEAGAAFKVVVDAVEGTDLPIWSEIRAAVNGALEDYTAKAFDLTFEPIAAEVEPTCVKYVRKGKRLYIEYNQDLTVHTGVQNSKQCNSLPIDFAKDVPPVLQALKDAKIVARYRMIALVERNPKS